MSDERSVIKFRAVLSLEDLPDDAVLLFGDPNDASRLKGITKAVVWEALRSEAVGLDPDVIAALENAPTAPSEENPFVTFDDVQVVDGGLLG